MDLRPILACRTSSLCAVALAVACALAACGARDADGRPPDLILVVLDTVRRDVTGLTADSEDSSTPRLDALGARGTRFVNAWSCSPWTVPSHASVFTGLLPSEHGATSRAPALRAQLPTLAERLAGHGYETAAFFSNPWLSDAASGLLRGFATRGEAPIGGSGVMRSTDGDQGGGRTLANVRRWLDEREPDRPFFLFVNLLEAHLPYDPPADLRARWLADLPPDARRTIGWAHAVNARVRTPGPGGWEQTRRLYRTDVRAADRLLGELVDELRGRGLLDDAVLVVTSDHGENLGEHGLAEHQFSVHETLLAVPLVVVAPSGICAPGLRTDPVLLTDLYTTLLGLAGLGPEPLPRHARFLFGSEGLQPATRSLVAEYAPPADGLLEALARRNPELDLAPFRRGYRTIRVGDERLTLASDGTVVLHDLAADPGQTSDLSTSEPERVERLRSALAELRELHAPSAGQPARDLDPETAQRLRALGYFR